MGIGLATLICNQRDERGETHRAFGGRLQLGRDAAQKLNDLIQ